jgi:hypothetical protein
VADVFVADHSFNPGWAGAALVIAVCAFAKGGIVTTIDGKHAAISAQLSYNLQHQFLMLLKIQQ